MEQPKPKLITLTNDADYPLSEEEIVEATIAFASGAKILLKDRYPYPAEVAARELAWTRYFKKHISAVRSCAKGVLRSWKSGEVTLPDVAKAEWEAMAQMTTVEQLEDIFRERVRLIISLSLTDPDESATLFWAGLQGDFPAMPNETAFRVNHSIGPSDKGIKLVIYYEFPTFFNLVILGLTLLLDESRRFRQKLCECQWTPCRLFFFEIKPPTGRPQRKYCCSEHMLKAHDENAANRMKKRRRAPAGKK
jgi:hypothetical protein